MINASPGPDEKLGLNQQISNAELANTELESKLKEAKLALKREQVARRFVLASLQAQLVTATQDQTSLEEDLRTYEDKTRKVEADLSTALSDNEGLVKEVHESSRTGRWHPAIFGQVFFQLAEADR